MADLAFRFQQFAVNTIAIGIKQEYTNALGRWRKQNNDLLAAAKTAFNSQQNYLKEIRAKQQESTEAIMFALMLLGGPAFSWVSGAIQYKLAPRWFGNATSKLRQVPNPRFKATKAQPRLPKGGSTIAPNPHPNNVTKPTLPLPFRSGDRVKPQLKRAPDKPLTVNEPEFLYVEVFDPQYSKVAGKVYGDFTGQMSQRLWMGAAKYGTEPKTQKEKLQASVNLAAAVSLSSLEAFESAMNNAWEDAKMYGETGIVNFAGAIDTDPTWGERFMKEHQIKDGPDTPGNSLYDRLAKGMEIILTMLDEQRSAWARNPDWFYFGNDPIPVSKAFAENAMEAQLWAEWIESEDFKLKHEHSEDSDGVTRIDADEATGNSGIKIDLIVSRLVKLGVVTAEAHYEVMRRVGARNSNSIGLQDAEVDDIDGKVDTEAELRSIRRWATGRRPDFIGGGFGSTPRPIGRFYPTNVPI